MNGLDPLIVQAVEDAVRHAIRAMGLEAFRKTSFFASNN